MSDSGQFDEDEGPLNCTGCERVIPNLDDAHQISEVDEDSDLIAST